MDLGSNCMNFVNTNRQVRNIKTSASAVDIRAFQLTVSSGPHTNGGCC